jgi:tRNA pseudouridine38-40 synthase
LSGSRTIKLIVEYDGTAYGGWQRQSNAPSIQQALEDTLIEMTKEAELHVIGAGRTDAGVHALGQAVTFVTGSRIPTYGFLRGLNTLLPADISVRSVEEKAPDFDARRSAEGKHYRYRILNQPPRSALRDRYVWHIPAPPLDVARMHAAAAPLRGKQDFASFRAADCERRTTVRELHRLDVTRVGDEIVVDVEGTAFLKNMVRIIVGTLCGAGRGELSPEDMAAIRDARDRTRAGMTAPPHGLYLVEVFYEQARPREV